jgi:UDP-N-acetylglucosamine diphosphorylase / glucose-1-phosphate thymidylyltransferase / UDP-N-acetylgalactosamine diphosphorylase / glucosamine-1-phosphate N-acetyltransferase / galactosamine-1-phosphate N-acetyltransferase
VVANAEAIVRELLGACGAELERRDDVAVHRSATIESGAVIKGPAIICAGCFIAAGAYLRGGVWLDESCVIGPGAELKSSFVFGGSKLAHFNFVGDSILGSGVNLEAGSILANFRNERADKKIRVRVGTELQRTGVEKFGALVGDGALIGANAVIAPGALIPPGQVVPRLSLLDQDGG